MLRLYDNKNNGNLEVYCKNDDFMNLIQAVKEKIMIMC